MPVSGRSCDGCSASSLFFELATMHFLLSPIGSAGDVHPIVGIGIELRRRGHQVTMMVCEYFEPLVRRVGLEYVELGTREEFLESIEHPDLWDPARAFEHVFRKGIEPAMRQQYRRIEERWVPQETVVLASCLGFGARIAQEKLGVPTVTYHCQPAVVWSEYESPELPMAIIPNALAPRWLRRLQFWLGEKLIIDRVARPETNSFRAELGLPPMRKTVRWWHSPELVVGLWPEWYAPIQADWPKNVVLTHFPLWDERGVTSAPRELELFLQGGDPPLVFTPGSAMRFGRPFFEAAVEACRLLKRRGLLLSRFGENIPADLPEEIRHFEYVPFSELLPRSDALVHHGGIGTTAQGLAAGIPQLIMPLAHDQPDNAARLRRLGVGDSLLPSAFHGPEVANRLNSLLTSTATRTACDDVAARFRERSGIREAADAIETFAQRRLPARGLQHASH